jgi:ABC-type multidrug transport system fused ATPase/permease subunit
MGGASEVIARLSDGFDTYLERPVQDLYDGLPDGASVFGGKVDNGYLRGIMDTPTNKSLSGGEMQRVAVARTFMRSMSEEQKVGLLLFDEPSASLDPKAEQGMTSAPMTFVHVYLRMLMWIIGAVYRSVLAASRVAREQDDDILDASVWGPYTTR